MKQNTPTPFSLQHIYPQIRHFLGFGRILYEIWVYVFLSFKKRKTSSVIPGNYNVCNTDTVDSQFNLFVLAGEFPADVDGSLYIVQCLGSPKAFMVGDTNIVRLDFDKEKVTLINRLMRTPASLARVNLANTKYKFDFFGLMYLSPGLGMYSYAEGIYLLPAGNIAVTSDIDRPWVIDPHSLETLTPIGRRDEWMPMMTGSAGEALGSLFPGINNSHALCTDKQTAEVFMVNYQKKQPDGAHPTFLLRWDGKGDFERWLIVSEEGEPIEIEQSIHELVFSKNYILLADTAFVTGTEMFTPWKSAPLPKEKTIVYIVDRRALKPNSNRITAKRMEVNEACIHLLAEYEDMDDSITVYMLHTPATNTAELIQEHDRDLDGRYFSKPLIGYGTLPVLDLSSVGKHVFDMKQGTAPRSQYLAQMPYTWGPYLYTYLGAKTSPFHGQDLFVMFKGFSKEILPERIFKAYKDVDSRKVSLEQMVGGEGLKHNSSICRIVTTDFKIADAYVFPDRVLPLTIACLDATDTQSGYVIAGIVTDIHIDGNSSGHEYWLFRADDLAGGPICKLGHPSLNNSTLFHGVFLPNSKVFKTTSNSQPYHISLRDDYPEHELNKWGDEIVSLFHNVIFPYFNKTKQG